MKAWEIQGAFGLDNLRQADRPDPQPGHGEIAVRVKAVSLNYRDLMMVNGLYNPKQPLPLIPCSDGAGIVEAVGPGVTRFAVGDTVCGSFFQDWIAGPPSAEKVAKSALGGPLDGMLAERVVLKADGAVHAPAHMSCEEAATLPCAALTAWSALVRLGGVKAGDTVLTLGTGGVSIFAVQLARLMGAEAIVTSSSPEKLERAMALGASHGIDYRATPEWGKAVKGLTAGRGVDHVVELGGAGTLEQSLRAVRIGGTVSLIGVLAGVAQPLNVIPILMQEIRVQGVFVGPREAFEDMNRAFAAADLKPVIDRVFPFDDAPDAFAHMASAAHFGKIVIAV